MEFTITEPTDRIIADFPVTLGANESFRFTFEGASYRAQAQYPHVFHDAAALADHLSRSARGLYSGLELIPAQEVLAPTQESRAPKSPAE